MQVLKKVIDKTEIGNTSYLNSRSMGINDSQMLSFDKDKDNFIPAFAYLFLHNVALLAGLFYLWFCTLKKSFIINKLNQDYCDVIINYS